MKKDKKFDCVKMKWDIQKQIRKEFEGIPEVEARQMQMRQVEQDPILGPFYKHLASVKQSSMKQ
jgi:hypothetical protein